MPTIKEPLYSSNPRARTARASSSSRHVQSSHHSYAGSSGTRLGPISRESSEAPPTYESHDFRVPKDTRLQLDGAREPQEQSIVRAPRPSSSRRTQEPSLVKERIPSLRDREQPQHHHHIQSLSSMSEQSSRGGQEPSIIKQPIYSQRQPLQHRPLSRIQELTLEKQPLPGSFREQPRYPASIQKEPISSMRKETSQFKSQAPPAARSTLTTPEDIEMASRQTRIESLPPKERKTQEEWAQNMILRAGVCPQHYTWRRMPGGYQCEAGGHGITDELLAEGKGGMIGFRTGKWGVSDGVYYPDPNRPGRWVRCDGNASFRGN